MRVYDVIDALNTKLKNIEIHLHPELWISKDSFIILKNDPEISGSIRVFPPALIKFYYSYKRIDYEFIFKSNTMIIQAFGKNRQQLFNEEFSYDQFKKECLRKSYDRNKD